MITQQENTIAVDVEYITDLINILKTQEVVTSGKQMFRCNLLRQHLERKLADFHEAKHMQTKLPEQWDIVEPKPGKNNFRAGNTAYGRAVMIYPDQGVFASEDGEKMWKDIVVDHHVVIGRLTTDKIIQLHSMINNKFGGMKPIIG